MKKSSLQESIAATWNCMNGNNTPLFTYASCKSIDRESIENGLSEIQLMGQAALASFYQLTHSGQIKKMQQGGKLFLLCGTGNNGGDARALAYMLLSADISFQKNIQIFQSGECKTETAKFYDAKIQKMGIVPKPLKNFLQVKSASHNDIIVDALLGVGQEGPPKDEMLLALTKITDLRLQKERPAYISLDVPTGLCENEPIHFSSPGEKFIPEGKSVSGKNSYPAPDEIHSYGTEKLAIRLNAQLSAYSRVHRLPMGFDPASLPKNESGKYLFQDHPSLLEDFIKSPVGHKYTAGHALLLGGSRSMEGAIILASRAFFAAGGGILHAIVPESESREFLTASNPTAMFLDSAHFPPENLLPGAIGMGPGLSKNDLTNLEDRVIRWLQNLPDNYVKAGKNLPYIVIDAGALPIILNKNFPEILKPRTIVTPHTGEWAALGGTIPNSVSRLEESSKWNSEKIGAWALIKGSISLLLDPEKSQNKTWIYSKPLSSLAVAGSGDTLTGILLASLARAGSSTVSIPDHIHRSLYLHSASAERMVHPESENFENLIRTILAEKKSQK